MVSCCCLLQFSALSALDEQRLAGLILAPVLGRWGIALALVAFPYARTSGLGREIKDNARWPQTALAAFFALVTVIGAAWLGNPWAILAAVIAALVTWLAVTRFTLKRIPGLTGDIYGAINLLIETTVLLAILATQPLFS